MAKGAVVEVRVPRLCPTIELASEGPPEAGAREKGSSPRGPTTLLKSRHLTRILTSTTVTPAPPPSKAHDLQALQLRSACEISPPSTQLRLTPRSFLTLDKATSAAQPAPPPPLYRVQLPPLTLDRVRSQRDLRISARSAWSSCWTMATKSSRHLTCEYIVLLPSYIYAS